MMDSNEQQRIAEHDGGLPRVLMIVGSLREQSFNRQLAQYAASVLDGQANVDFLDWKDVPIFNQDDEFPAPRAIAEVRRQVNQADALWIVTPEYNWGVPGALKNLLDWLSRPLEDGSPSVIVGKTVTVSGAGGANCVRNSFADLMTILHFFKMDIVPVTFTGIVLDRTMFETDRLELDIAGKASIAEQARVLNERLLA